MKNIKYYSGFADSDGSFMLDPYKTKEGYVVRSRFTATQNKQRSYILEPIAVEFGVDVKTCERENKRNRKTYTSSSVTLTGDKALRFMQQCKKHLVLKYDIVEFLLSVDGKVVQSEDLKLMRIKLKELRDSIKPSHKTKVSRQWMAGYIDGDGCLSSSFRKRDGNLEFHLCVASNINDPQPLDLLHSHFKGYLIKNGKCMWWKIGLNKNNVEKVLGHCVKHLVLKRTQADFILNVLRKGLNKKSNGATWDSNKELHETLKKLKASND